MILCDTNILIEFYKNSARIVPELRHIGPTEIAVSVITQAVYYGALNKAELNKIKKHLLSLHHISIDVAISNRFLSLMERYSLSHKLSLPDALIAATALEQGMELYTLNLSDFRYIPELKLYRPLTY
jgi:tRNA(fMet)-specific endonuclease VapC